MADIKKVSEKRVMRESEISLAKELREKYGEGEFDINTGVFTPRK